MRGPQVYGDERRYYCQWQQSRRSVRGGRRARACKGEGANETVGRSRAGVQSRGGWDSGRWAGAEGGDDARGRRTGARVDIDTGGMTTNGDAVGDEQWDERNGQLKVITGRRWVVWCAVVGGWVDGWLGGGGAPGQAGKVSLWHAPLSQSYCSAARRMEREFKPSERDDEGARACVCV